MWKKLVCGNMKQVGKQITHMNMAPSDLYRSPRCTRACFVDNPGTPRTSGRDADLTSMS